MELLLEVDTEPDETFTVFRRITESADLFDAMNSVLIVDYKYAPWIRREGNLLWR